MTGFFSRVWVYGGSAGVLDAGDSNDEDDDEGDDVITSHYVSHEDPCASPHAACAAAVCHCRPKPQESASVSDSGGWGYFSPSSSSEQESALPDGEGWLAPGLISNPFLGLLGARPQRGLTAMNSHHIQKRKCNTATCVTQRLADFLVRSSNTVGTVYAPTNVGSATYGKRELLQNPSYISL
ncbi:hypothetical protein Q8A73_022100 [Channa argus]|nr:hypothetical protein Q8A73_022100 [Channa argus]